jgi:hypothetical protein
MNLKSPRKTGTNQTQSQLMEKNNKDQGQD